MNWEEEKECFQKIATEFGWFYGIQHDPFLLDSSEEEQQKMEDKGECSSEDIMEEKREVGAGTRTESKGEENDLKETAAKKVVYTSQ